MDTREWDERISALECSMAGLQGRMETEAQLFMDRVAEWMVSWWEESARQAVGAAAEKLAPSTVPEELVRKTRAGVRGLVANAGGVVRKHLDVDEVWAHRQNVAKEAVTASGRYGFETRSSMRSPRKLPTEIEERTRRAMGEVGVILVEHRLAEAAHSSARVFSEGWTHDRGSLRYPFGIIVPEEVDAALDRYRSLFEELRKTLEQLTLTRAAKARAIADEQWESA